MGSVGEKNNIQRATVAPKTPVMIRRIGRLCRRQVRDACFEGDGSGDSGFVRIINSYS